MKNRCLKFGKGFLLVCPDDSGGGTRCEKRVLPQHADGFAGVGGVCFNVLACCDACVLLSLQLLCGGLFAPTFKANS